MSCPGFSQLKHGRHVLGPLEDSRVQLDVLCREERAVEEEENPLRGHGYLVHQSGHGLVHLRLQVALKLNLL